jgi:hypothetical protein
MWMYDFAFGFGPVKVKPLCFVLDSWPVIGSVQ